MLFILMSCVFGALGFGLGFTLGAWRFCLSRRKTAKKE